MSLAIAMFFRPIGALILFGLICLPVRFACRRYFPDGAVKRLLLRELKRPKRR